MVSLAADDRDLGFLVRPNLVATTLAAVGWAATGATAGSDLPVGIPTEPVLVMTVLRALVVLWSVALLLAGFKLGRAVVATWLLSVGLVIGMLTSAHASILLAAAVAWSVTAVGIALYVVTPRTVMAVAMAWPLPALFIAHRYFSGSFDRNRPLLIALLVVGVVLGAVFPRRSLVVLSAALGTALLLLAGPVTASFAMVVVTAAVGIAWQTFVLGASRAPARDPRLAGQVVAPSRLRIWCGSVTWTAGALAGALVLIGGLTPAYGILAVPDPTRRERLAADRTLSRPALVMGSLNNLYLLESPVELALMDDPVGVTTRATFPVVGRVISREVARMRAVKDEREIEHMRRAAAITSLAFGEIHGVIRPGLSEADIEQLILDVFSRSGATGVAFPCIVGSGSNAVLPHYMRNDAEMKSGLVVIDIGSSVNGYASDMTRTFSVTGEYTEAQRELIETVIEAGDAAREILGPGASFAEVDAASRRVIDGAGFGQYYPHSVGHQLGLNVHESGRNPLEVGMAVTIEPGIYVPEGADLDPKYWNLGVRIEDTYIITETGWEEITSYPRRPYSLDAAITGGEPQK